MDMIPDGPSDRMAALEAEVAKLRETLRRVQRIGLVGSVEVDLRNNGFRNFRSPEYLTIHGLPPEAENETHEEWLARIHPDDRDRMERHFLNAVASDVTDYTAEYRVIRPSDGETRWIFAKGLIERDAQGAPLRFAGAHLDVTERRLMEQQSETVAREFAHRVKNLGAVVRALVTMSARGRPEARAFAEAVAGRIDALFRAKELVRPARHEQAAGHSLRELIDILLAPYADESGVIRVAGADFSVGPAASTALALALHELSTNAVKYGALSQPGGSVTITIAAEPTDIEIRWVETGGPIISGEPDRSGFGSDMLNRTLAGQLKAKIVREWPREGVRVHIKIPVEVLSR